MELRHLRYFLAVAEHLNFGRAAQALHTAQPSLSQQIRQLERELGVVLFERTKRYVNLTAEGRLLAEQSRSIIDAVDNLGGIFCDANAEPRGHLRIGAITPATIGVIPRIVPAYRERFPSITLRVETVSLDEHVRALVERRIDVAIFRGPVVDERIEAIPFARECFCVVLPRDHRLAIRPAVSLGDLHGETIIMLDRARGGSYNIDVYTMLRDRATVQTIETSDVETTFALVASGLGISIASTIAYGSLVQGVVYRPIVPRTAIDSMVVACRRDRRSVPAIASFMELLTSLELTFDLQPLPE